MFGFLNFFLYLCIVIKKQIECQLPPPKNGGLPQSHWASDDWVIDRTLPLKGRELLESGWFARYAIHVYPF